MGKRTRKKKKKHTRKGDGLYRNISQVSANNVCYLWHIGTRNLYDLAVYIHDEPTLVLFWHFLCCCSVLSLLTKARHHPIQHHTLCVCVRLKMGSVLFGLLSDVDVGRLPVLQFSSQKTTKTSVPTDTHSRKKASAFNNNNERAHYSVCFSQKIPKKKEKNKKRAFKTFFFCGVFFKAKEENGSVAPVYIFLNIF